ncbi:tyrosine-type recombinase/integrase [Halorhabdus salina]|uniref:tyrosine-type recombinase/integrase n=1 Tax=Halorhabdus salina TaxID=2750670 RepID=UPI0015EF3DED|nr:tyrosine-type recombinase/integrase [Halorhabdus salina]
MTDHSRDDALTDRQFERLLEGARQLPEPRDFEARFVVLVAGRLGLRGGEIAHLSADWIDEDQRVISIPEHDPCTKGKDGGVCGYCRERAAEHVDAYNLSLDEATELVDEEMGDVDLPDQKIEELARERMDEHNISLEDALAERWEPKTSNGARTIPFDLTARTQIAVERFAERYDVFPKARVAVNRRVSEAASAADLDARVYPHALRATAANQMAMNDVSAHSLLALMGWSDIETARAYIKASEENAAREIRSKFR